MWFIGGSWSIESWSGKTEAWSWELGAGSGLLISKTNCSEEPPIKLMWNVRG
tara:strand:+ start:1264 stop:1419 length:156 start_codon:yes stop_codon:yes gene_type:complete